MIVIGGFHSRKCTLNMPGQKTRDKPNPSVYELIHPVVLSGIFQDIAKFCTSSVS